MLKIRTVKEDNLISKKIKISQNPKQELLSPKKTEEKEEENYDSDINTVYKTSNNSSTGSNCDSINDNQEKLNDSSNSFIEEINNTLSKDINKNKNFFPVIDYFHCNEKYFKEKMPEKSNYKINIF